MKLVSIKVAVSLAWVVTVCLAGIAAGVHSPANWALVFAVALVPSIVMMWWWNDPRETMSETIREARR